MQRTRGIAATTMLTAAIALGLAGCTAADDDASAPVPMESANPGIGDSDGMVDGLPAEYSLAEVEPVFSAPAGWPASVPLPEGLGYDLASCDGTHCLLASTQLPGYDALLAVKNPYLAALRADPGWTELSSLVGREAITFVSAGDQSTVLLVRQVLLTNTPGWPFRLTLELIWR